MEGASGLQNEEGILKQACSDHGGDIMRAYKWSVHRTLRIMAAASGLGLLGLLAGCGGVSVDASIGPNVPPNLPPITSEPISSLGVIAGSGGISVNGVRYDTSVAVVTMNGEAAFPAELRAGHTVAVRGRLESGGARGDASRIEYQAAVVGPVEAIDAAHGQAIVLGQTVMTDPATVFAGSGGLEAVQLGSRAQVSGFRDADGRIAATRIEPAGAGAALQVTGQVADLDLANKLFALDRLTVDYGSALVMNLAGGNLAEGAAVVVRGALANGLLRAETIADPPDPGFDTPDRHAQASGWVTQAGAGDFRLHGRRVSVNSSTRYSQGAAADLRANAFVTIDGWVSADGRSIRAQKVTFGRLPASVVGRAYAFADFDDVFVSGGFDAEILGGSGYLVEVAADPGLIDRVDVSRNGSRPEIGVRSGAPYQIDSLETRVALPVLNRLSVTGLSTATVSNFEQASLDLHVGGLGILQGRALGIDRLTAGVYGSGLLDLGGVQPIRDATVNVSGTSYVTLNMAEGSTLAGSVTGASSLQYYGTNVSVNVTKDNLSTVTRIGDTRP